MLDVEEIVFDAALDLFQGIGFPAPAVHLRPAGDAGLDPVARRVGVDHLVVELAAGLGGALVPGAWMVGGTARLLERAGPGVLFKDLAACNAYAEGMEGAAKITCPTTVIMGSEDRMTPARAGAKLAAAIPGAQGIVIPACGHMMLAEKPDETLDALRSVL